MRPKRHAPHTLPCASKTKTLDVQSLSYELLDPYPAGQASSLSMLDPFAPLGRGPWTAVDLGSCPSIRMGSLELAQEGAKP